MTRSPQCRSVRILAEARHFGLLCCGAWHLCGFANPLGTQRGVGLKQLSEAQSRERREPLRGQVAADVRRAS